VALLVEDPGMIVHLNHIAHGGTAPPALGQQAGEVLRALLALVDEGRIDPRTVPDLRVHLDWIQYRANFRAPVLVRRATDPRGEAAALAELAVDLRRVEAASLREALAAVLPGLTDDATRASDRELRHRYLEEWVPLRDSVIWRFNRLFWQHVAAWESAVGRRFEEALPGGRSDANHPEAVADSVADFWTLLRDLDKKSMLPPEIFALEIGVGSGVRAALWLDRFRALDEERATSYYGRLRFLLGDYSLPTLDRAMAAVQSHRDVVSVLALDALDPFKTLAFLRYKILYVHLTNVYDNLPHDELVRRDGRLYLVEARGYLAAADAERIAAAADLAPTELGRTIDQLLRVGPDALAPLERGVALWRAVWDALRLEERLVRLDDVAQAPLPLGLDQSHLEDLLEGAPDDVRFHLSRGAAESFVHTLPLLHPRGYLQVQDIFVTDMYEYRHGFRGPGKLDGSVVSWVNGALLRAIGARAGYDVHFAPFRYRAGSRTSILYTTPRE
jgi:hypothetical protein